MRSDFESRLVVGHPHAVVMGITGNWAFAAGTVLLALRRHNPLLAADILVFCDQISGTVLVDGRDHAAQLAADDINGVVNELGEASKGV